MMRWKLWDNEKDGFPPRYSVVLNDGTSSRCMVLQQEIPEEIEVRHVSGQFSHWIDGFIWEDVPLHIERKE